MAPKLSDIEAQWIDYRLNQLGIRVHAAFCQLIAMSKGDWRPIGLARPLPVHVPASSEEAQAAVDDPLKMTAYQYCQAHYRTDLAQVLSQAKPFAEALKDKDAETANML